MNKEKKQIEIDWDEDPTKDPFYHLLQKFNQEKLQQKDFIE